MVAKVSPGEIFSRFSKEINQKGEKDIDTILSEISSKIIPGMLHWNHPNNIAWFPNLSPRAVVFGAMLENALNSIGFSWASSPALTELEQVIYHFHHQTHFFLFQVVQLIKLGSYFDNFSVAITSCTVASAANKLGTHFGRY